MPDCTAVATLETHPVDDIHRIEYRFPANGNRQLVVTMDSIDGKPMLDVIFNAPVAFRVIDELHLTEFWNEYSLPNGWLWRVHAGGYFDLECSRKTFISDFYSTTSPLEEYLIVADQCVSVIAVGPPVLMPCSIQDGG